MLPSVTASIPEQNPQDLLNPVWNRASGGDVGAPRHRVVDTHDDDTYVVFTAVLVAALDERLGDTLRRRFPPRARRGSRRRSPSS